MTTLTETVPLDVDLDAEPACPGVILAFGGTEPCGATATWVGTVSHCGKRRARLACDHHHEGWLRMEASSRALCFDCYAPLTVTWRPL